MHNVAHLVLHYCERTAEEQSDSTIAAGYLYEYSPSKFQVRRQASTNVRHLTQQSLRANPKDPPFVSLA